MNRLLFACLAPCAFLIVNYAGYEDSQKISEARPHKTTAFQISATHPGYNQSAPLLCSLIQVRNDHGFILEYYLDVDSVACRDSVCEIVTVRIFWDALGRYRRYTLPKGGALTKKGHELFSDADHAKLHSILTDANSSLQHVSIDQVSSPDQAMEDVDAISGATPLSQRDSVVPGAVYTTYTLWHWANGPIRQTVYRQTEQACSQPQLLSFLNSADKDFTIFAINQFTARRIHSQSVRKNIIKQTQQGDISIVEPAIAYFKSMATASEAKVYYDAIETLFLPGTERQRIKYLDSLSSTTQPAPPGYFKRFSGKLSKLRTYYEIHRFLKLMEARNHTSPELTQQALTLLNGSEFFIARRAFYYLKDRTLSPAQSQAVEAFRLKHSDRL
jgi:hypothetical protein